MIGKVNITYFLIHRFIPYPTDKLLDLRYWKR